MTCVCMACAGDELGAVVPVVRLHRHLPGRVVRRPCHNPGVPHQGTWPLLFCCWVAETLSPHMCSSTSCQDTNSASS